MEGTIFTSNLEESLSFVANVYDFTERNQGKRLVELNFPSI